MFVIYADPVNLKACPIASRDVSPSVWSIDAHPMVGSLSVFYLTVHATRLISSLKIYPVYFVS